VTAKIIQFATRQPLITGHIPEYDDRVGYIIEITPTNIGCSWKLYTGDNDQEPYEDQVANDLSAIALSLRPPPRTFLERLRYLFTGEPE